MKTIFFSFLFLFLVAFAPLTASAQKKIFKAQRIIDQPPVIDGKLDESIWNGAVWGENYVQENPFNGDAPSQETKFTIRYDDNYLYVAILALDTEPDKIVNRITRRDNLDGDTAGIQIDSYNDKRTAFAFSVSSAGVKGDWLVSGDGNNWDSSWDPIWYTAVDRNETGWTAEFQIPLTQLRFDSNDEQEWGLQMGRWIHRKQEFSTWQPKPREIPGWVSSYGLLHGIDKVKPKRRIEIIPYTVGKHKTALQEAGNPFSKGNDNSFVGGFDAKVGVTNNLNLDITINPDFGQVEADPSEVNLGAFETFFPEKRQFFVEGGNILNFQINGNGGGGPFANDKLFHSRRVGRNPGYEPDTDDDEYFEGPNNTSILAALKLTGKTKSGYSIGILESVTENEKGDFFRNGAVSRVDTEPMTNFLVGRIQKDYHEGNTVLGGMITATNRKNDVSQFDDMTDAAYSGGLDFRKQWKNKTYNFTVNSVFSNIRGTAEAIKDVQKSSRRYFQRPDNDYADYDPTRTSLSGHGGYATLSKGGNSHWNYGTSFTWRSPGLELNDVGFLRNADRMMHTLFGGYRQWNPRGIFNNYNINVAGWRGWNFGQEVLFTGTNFNFNSQLKNFWNINAGFTIDSDYLSAEQLRGGPSFTVPGSWNQWVNITTDNRKNLIFRFNNWNLFDKENESDKHQISLGVTWKPSNSILLSLDPSFNDNNDALQYVDDVKFGNDTRYILAKVNQKTFSLTSRLNYSITPNLTVQFYGQPFFSAGSYNDFKFATDTRAGAYRSRFQTIESNQMSLSGDDYHIDENRDGSTDYRFEKPDFKFFQFNSNLVVRWEYSPGSTVFFVWTQDRSGDISHGKFSFRRDFRSLFNYHPDNVFLIKFNRWFKM